MDMMGYMIGIGDMKLESLDKCNIACNGCTNSTDFDCLFCASSFLNQSGQCVSVCSTGNYLTTTNGLTTC